MTPAQDNDYQSLQRIIAELQVENERLKADKQRLDWYQDNGTLEVQADGSWKAYDHFSGAKGVGLTVRDAIDQARAQ